MRPAAVVLLAGAALLGTAGTASAHSVLVSMEPAVGSTVSTAPTQVVLTFDEAVQHIGDAVVVTAPNGTRVDDGAPVISGVTVTEHLSPLPQAGSYSVSYRVVSDDGHPVTRTLTFRFVGTPDATSSTFAATGPAAVPVGSSSGATGSVASKIAVLALLLFAGVIALLVVLVNQAKGRPKAGDPKQ